MKIVFLDIDGVLNTIPGTSGRRPHEDALDADKVARIAAFVEAQNALVVITSQLRLIKDLCWFRDALEAKGLPRIRVLDTTPTPADVEHALVITAPTRGDEIKLWLHGERGSDARGYPIEAFVIFDDSTLMSGQYEGLGRHLVTVDRGHGLTDIDCRFAARVLEDR